MTAVTVVFADLTGSTGVFESLGNARATQAITRLTHWIGTVCAARGGRVVKYLGDGVLMVFPQNSAAVDAATEMQRVHSERIGNWPEKLQMRLQIGLARGKVVEQDGDCFGDAVNVASRLSDLSGPDQIFATDVVIQHLPDNNQVRFRSLGPMDIRGRSELCVVYRIEWQSEVLSEFLTVPSSLVPMVHKADSLLHGIELSWLDIHSSFESSKLPIFLGRINQAQFMVNDPRVSRLHAKIMWHAGQFIIEDVSSYGTWVRFAGSDTIIALRREQCVLYEPGEIALGASFDDFAAPTVNFKFTGDAVQLSRGTSQL